MIPQILKKIRLLRLEQGLSQQNLADYLNITQSSFAKIERGETKLNLETYLCLCNILQVSPIEIMASALTPTTKSCG